MTESEYHEIPYSCAWCGKSGVALIAKCCDLDWAEKLYAFLTCNRCADKLVARSEALVALRSVSARLEIGSMTTRNGTRGLSSDERNDLERTKAICRRKLAEITGTLNAARKPISSAHGNATGTSLRADQPSQP